MLCRSMALCATHETILRASVARRTVHDLARALSPQGVVCAPLKGALLCALVPGFTRAFSDVDVLVRPADSERARAALENLGYRLWTHQPFATMFVHPDRPMPVDLHRACFPTGLFALHTEGVFARSHADADLFDADVRIVDPIDMYALCIGHFAKDRLDGRRCEPLGDLALIADHFGLDPAAVARHLQTSGLARAALYALDRAEALLSDRFAGEVRKRIRHSAGDRVAVGMARGWIERLPPRTPVSAPAAHVLNRSLTAGARSFAAHAAEAFPRRMRALGRRLRGPSSGGAS
jgi:hypothetical protein